MARKIRRCRPSTNTIVQPDYDSMRPPGVTNHFSRIAIPDTKLSDDKTFMTMMENIRVGMVQAVDVAMSMDPQCVVLGMSAETFWDGPDGAERLHQRVLEHTHGVPVILGSTALRAAIAAYGKIKIIGVMTPYMPVGDANVRKYFEDEGFEVVQLYGLKSPSPQLIAHETREKLKTAVLAVAEGVDAIIQCGTNLAFTEVAVMAEFWFGKPVIAINTATYWHALRTIWDQGPEDRLRRPSSELLEQHPEGLAAFGDDAGSTRHSI